MNNKSAGKQDSQVQKTATNQGRDQMPGSSSSNRSGTTSRSTENRGQFGDRTQQGSDRSQKGSEGLKNNSRSSISRDDDE